MANGKSRGRTTQRVFEVPGTHDAVSRNGFRKNIGAKEKGQGMLQPAPSATGSLVVEGARIDMIECGSGRPLLFLHPENGIEPAAAVIDELAKAAHVFAPTHPAFGRSELPAGMRTVDDLSYFYLDLLDQLDLRDLTVVGVSLGAWIAAEIAVKSTARMSRLVMANAVGVKVGDRETRDIADIFAITDKEYLELTFCDPSLGQRDYKALPDAEVLAAARAREATARFAWNPYFHNPRLKSRLHRIGIPTLFLWGSHDRMLSEAYGRAYCAMIPGARFEAIDRAGHFPHQEQPKVFAERVLAFAGGN
jgi:pimeloyl-ACP methyl ester carboxylesterase